MKPVQVNWHTYTGREAASGNHLPWPQSLWWRKARSRQGHVDKLDRQWARIADRAYLCGLAKGEERGLVLAKLRQRLAEARA